jgi:hypothetical protein
MSASGLKRRYVALAVSAVAAAAVGSTRLGTGAHPTLSASSAPAASASSVPAVNASISELLTKVSVVDELPHVPGYERGCGTDKKTQSRQGCVFGPAWNDPSDTSGCDTRNRVLAAQLHDTAFKPGTRRCKVTAGWLIDPYTGQRITLHQIEIDHIVPLHRAFDSGAATWDLLRRRQFANDTRNLLAVSAHANQSKGDSGPGQWLPDNPAERCPYVTQYLAVTVDYQLPITRDDKAAAITACAAQR